MTYIQSKPAPATTTERDAPCGCGCGGKGGHTPEGSCCSLVCFERPNYFCGHLLSDADLSLEQTYLREKNKLYHRGIDGYGVVCGLRITCDPKCDGYIRIGDGFAIDQCGNDLVVCSPRPFDVIGALRKKKWIVDSAVDPCQPADTEKADDCVGKQCFYLGICYTEELAEFVSPFQTDCSPGPGACEATRIREGVRFEIYDELPRRPNPLDDIEKRIEHCFRIFREGTFAKGLRVLAPSMVSVLGNQEGGEATPHQVCCQLRGLFLQQLRICPDPYNCDLEYEVTRLECPPEQAAEGGRDAAAIVLKKLFVLIERYVFGCVLGELVVACPQPCGPGCIVIGSVEVEDGCVRRVLNYPRWYLWSFANFFEVLVSTLVNEAACQLAPAREGGCCPNFDDDLEGFLALFEINHRATELMARSPVQAVKALYSAMVSGADFFSRGGVPTELFRGMSVKDAQDAAGRLNIKTELLGESTADDQDPVSAVLRKLVHRGGLPLGLFTEADGIHVSSATRTLNAPARDSAAAQDLQSTVDRLTARLASLEAEVHAQKNTPVTRKGKGNPSE